MRPGLVRRAATLLVWGLAFWVLLSVGSRGTTFQERVREALPAVGHVLPLDSIGKQFGVDLGGREAGGEIWLLVLTSTCPGCLGLGGEIPAIVHAAACAGADLVPLVVIGTDGGDSIRSLLQASGLPHHYVGGPDGLSMLQVFAVPSIVQVDAGGRVKGVANPDLGDWPPPAHCEASPADEFDHTQGRVAPSIPSLAGGAPREPGNTFRKQSCALPSPLVITRDLFPQSWVEVCPITCPL